MRIGILASHPIQYHAPWFRALAKEVELEVFFAHRPSAREQASGFGGSFQWDVDLLSGYKHTFLKNVAPRPGVNHFFGCDTPAIADIIRGQQDPLSRGRRRFDAFIVMGWNLKSYWQAVNAAHANKFPVLVRTDSQLQKRRSVLAQVIKPLIYPRLLRRFDGFLYVGKRSREYLEHYRVAEHKMFLVPHFIDNGWFAAQAAKVRGKRSEIRSEWGVDMETFVVLFVGKFVPIKRPGDILYALATLKAAGVKAIGIFVGAGELETELRDFAQKLQVRARFEGFKNQTELPRYYVAADVLVLPSESETWGLVVNEAMACGLPSIVSDAVGCAPDLINEGKTGFTFAVRNLTELGERLAAIHGVKSNGYDFQGALAEKMRAYSLEKGMSKTLEAIRTVSCAIS